jgi:hypothetical protein
LDTQRRTGSRPGAGSSAASCCCGAWPALCIAGGVALSAPGASRPRAGPEAWAAMGRAAGPAMQGAAAAGAAVRAAAPQRAPPPRRVRTAPASHAGRPMSPRTRLAAAAAARRDRPPPPCAAPGRAARLAVRGSGRGRQAAANLHATAPPVQPRGGVPKGRVPERESLASVAEVRTARRLSRARPSLRRSRAGHGAAGRRVAGRAAACSVPGCCRRRLARAAGSGAGRRRRAPRAVAPAPPPTRPAPPRPALAPRAGGQRPLGSRRRAAGG